MPTKEKIISPELRVQVFEQKDRSPENIKTLIQQINAGEITELDFPCIVYVDGENTNHYRFYTDDLADFAASFKNAPFLYDHDTRSVAKRHGSVTASELVNNTFRQTVKLTTPDAMLHFARGNIDRFSIGWYYSGVDCSICKTDWYQCNHWPGKKYEQNGGEVRCELYFVNPRGKEVSAVNAPAVQGTALLGETTMSNSTENNQAQPEISPVMQLAPQGVTEATKDVTNDWLNLTLSILSPAQATAARSILSHADNLTPAFAQQVISTLSSVIPTQPVALSQTPTSTPTQPQVVVGHPPITSGHTAPRDRFLDAWIYHFGGKTNDIVPHYARDIRALYQDMTGDVYWRGIVDREHSLAAASSVNLPSIVADALNRVLVPLWDAMEVYKWYYPIVKVTPNDGTLQSMKWITLGGISNLPLVEEGSAYTEASLTDSKETNEFLKYGLYVGLTMEMVRKSLVLQIQEIPRLVALACHRTRSALVASIFTSNSGVGPTLEQDGKALFHADHSNLATTAFSHSAWSAMRTSMFNQPELGSGKPIAVWPRYCLLPVGLYDEAREVFGYGSGSEGKPMSASGRAVNPFGQDMQGDPRPMPLVVPDFTDTNDWAGVADPLLHPVIHMSYGQSQRGGEHAMPEIFSATDPTTGLNFTNDTLAVKVRDLVSLGVSGYRGIAKRNVA